MSEVALIDTSVFLNILNVPGWNQDATPVLQDLERFTAKRLSLFLPIAVIFETGNHIAQVNGGNRRCVAKRFVQLVEKAISGEAPWKVTRFPVSTDMAAWLRSFPDRAAQGGGAR